MRVYNLYGRRDNKYKARIKILVHEIGAEKFKAEVEAEYARRPEQTPMWKKRKLRRIAAYFAPPVFENCRASHQPSRRQNSCIPALPAGPATISRAPG